MPLMKLCRCGAKIPYSDKACVKCMPKIEMEAKERYKKYANNRQDKDIQKIYSSGKWEKVKDACKTRQNGMCLYNYYLYGEVKPIELYHHIIETKEDIGKAYDSGNVIGVTDSVHKLIHSAYKQGLKEKKEMQKFLYGLIARWENEMYN